MMIRNHNLITSHQADLAKRCMLTISAKVVVTVDALIKVLHISVGQNMVPQSQGPWDMVSIKV